MFSLSPQAGDVSDIRAVKHLATFARITGDFHRNWHQTFAHFAAVAAVANETASNTPGGQNFFLDLDLLPFGMEMGYPPNEPPWTPARGMPFWEPVRRSIMSLWVMASSPLQYSGDVRTSSKDPVSGVPYWTAELQELLTFVNAHKTTHPEIRYTRQLDSRFEFASVDGVRSLVFGKNENHKKNV